jgi:predicted phage tail protein
MEEKDLDIISGSGGGKSSSPSTADDNLDSLATVKILDAICEGTIEGFPSARDANLAFGSSNYNKFALKDIYLDDTPVVDETAKFNTETSEFEDDDINFENVSINSRVGTNNQTFMTGFRATREEITVNSGNIQKADPNVGVSRNFNIADFPLADQIKVIINVPALQVFEDDGDIVGTQVFFRIEYRIDGGSNPNTEFVSAFPDNQPPHDDAELGDVGIAGRTGDPYQRQFRFKVPDNYQGATTFNLRVIRKTDNSTTKIQNDIQWFSYQILDFDKKSYPDTALVGFEASSEDFSSIPRRYYRLRGTKVAVPKNVYTDNNNPTDAQRPGRLVYNPSATWPGGNSLTANGTLRGSWQRLYTNDPAFCLYDLLVNTRYGLSIPETALDEYSFWNISKYNNELVSNQRDDGGTKNGTWTLTANRSFCVVVCTVAHNYQTNDLVEITFTSTSDPGNAAPATLNTPVVFKIIRTGNRRFQALNVTSSSTNMNGNCSFNEVGQEARFSFNEYIKDSLRSYDLINAICSNMRVMPYWSAGTLFLSQDKPAPQVNGGVYNASEDVLPAYIFTNANVIEGNFTYEGSDIKSRSTLVIAKYYDNNQRKISYEQFPEPDVIANTTIGDPSAGTGANPPRDETIAKYGIVKKEIQAFGCTSSGQAHRLAKWTRESEQLLTETVTFQVSIETGVMVRPGQVIAINDEVKTGTRRGGRIFGVSGTNQITVDDASASNLPADSVSYTRTLNVLMPDGSVSKKSVSSISGANITVTGNFQTADGTDAAPNVMSTWILETSGGTAAQNLQNQLYRVLLVTEEEKFIYKVTALLYNHSIYASVETGSLVKFRDASNLDVKPKKTSAASFTERLYKDSIHNANNNSNKIKIRSKLIIQWKQVEDVSKFLLRINVNGTERTEEVQGLSFEILNVQPNKNFTVKIFSIGNASGKLSRPRTISTTTVGQTEPPNDVSSSGYSVTANGTTAPNLVSFNENEPNPSFTSSSDSSAVKVQFKDLDIAFYEIQKSNTSLTTAQINALFGSKDAAFVGRPTSPDFITKDFLTENHTYYIKARDRGGRYSVNATSTVFNYVAPSTPRRRNNFPKLQNGHIVLNWLEPSTVGSYAIKHYVVTDETDTDIILKNDITTYRTPLTYAGSSKTFTITAVNFAGGQGATLTYIANVPMPSFPTGASIKVKITLDNIILKWPKVLNPNPSYNSTTNVQTTKIPNVIGYKVTTSYADATLDGEENIFSVIVKGTSLKVPISAANINRNNSNTTISRTFTVNPVYERADFPDEGVISSSQLTKSVDFTKPPAPSFKTPAFFFIGNQVRISWDEATGTFKTIKYGIYNNSNQLLFETDATAITIDVDFAKNNTNMSKNFKIAALDSGYVNESQQFIKDRFRGLFATQTVTVTPINPPSNGAYTLGSEGGQGFVTISFTPPTVNNQSNLGLKDYKITRSTSNTFSGVTNGNTDLVVFSDAEAFKEEVSWTINQGQRYYYIQTRDMNNNVSTTALQIYAFIAAPTKPVTSGTIEVIDNNVLLRWAAGTLDPSNQLKIATFEIRKHRSSASDTTDFDTAEVIGRIDGIFNVVFESRADTYTYHIAAVDTAGNIGPSLQSEQTVSQPPDFILNANYDSVYRTAFGTYSQSGTTVTVTLTDHRFSVGDEVTLFPTSGNAVGDLLVLRIITSVTNANTFVTTSSVSKTASGNVTVKTITGLTEPQEIDAVSFSNAFRVFDEDLNKHVLYLPVNTTETWSEHFIGTGSSSSPQFNNMNALITANPTNTHYLEPAPSTGHFIEDFDYGATLASTKITATQFGVGLGSGSLQHQGTINIGGNDSGSFTTDGIVQDGTSFSRFATSFRRVRYKTIVNSTNGKYRKINRQNLKIDTKILNDTGIGTANASDSGGTQVNFNVTFVDVQGISVTPNTINVSDDTSVNKKIIAVVDFLDAPNPTGFKVYLFNISGTRVSGDFTWQCRGT